MIEYKETSLEVIKKEVISITCDVCKENFDEKTQFMDTQEFHHVRISAGYCSAFGDGNQVEMDVCSACLEATFRDCYRITGNPELDDMMASVGFKYQGEGNDNEVRQEDDGNSPPMG